MDNKPDMEDVWTKVSGSPMQVLTDLEEMGSLQFPVSTNSFSVENQNQGMLLEESEMSQFFYTKEEQFREYANNADISDPMLGATSSSQEQLLSQGQLSFINDEVKDFMTDMSFGEIQDIPVEIQSSSALHNLNIAQNIQLMMEPGTSNQQKVLKTKSRLDVPRPLFAEVPEAINWPGQLNFNVKPSNGGNGKRCIFWSEKNKLYVVRDYHIPFKFQMNFEAEECWENFKISTMLVYTEAQYKDVPVLRCLVCKEKEKTSINPERIVHIVRCQHKSAIYTQDSTQRCSVSCQVQLPQSGVDYMTRDFMFTCLSSCKSGETGLDGGMQRRPAEIVFTLLDGEQNVRGRASFQVRICTAPLRDYNKDKSDAEALQTSNMAKKRKPRGGGSNVTPKQAKIVEVLVGNKEDDDMKVASSSQETVYSDEESDSNKIKLRSLLKKAKWALSYKYSDNRLLRAKAKEVFCSIKMTNTLVDNMAMMAEEMKSKDAAKGSPDHGYQEERD